MKGYKTKPEPQQPVVSSAASSTALPQPSARSITTPQEQKPTKSPSPQQATQAALAFAKTQPQYRPNQTQPVPQVDIERTMRNAPTTPLPQATPTKQSLFQRFRNRIGLEEAIKQAFKDAINNR
jgi:hypothetical protein